MSATLPTHRHSYLHAHLSADVVPCDTCGAPADAATVRRLRRRLKRLQRANAALARLTR